MQGLLFATVFWGYLASGLIIGFLIGRNSGMRGALIVAVCGPLVCWIAWFVLFSILPSGAEGEMIPSWALSGYFSLAWFALGAFGGFVGWGFRAP